MVKMEVYETEGRIRKFVVSGHAKYAKSGQDIVCSAVSALVLNAINSCEKLLDAKLLVKDDGDKLFCEVPVVLLPREDVQLLLQSMVYGVEQTAQAYPRYTKLQRCSVHQGKEAKE